MDVTSQLVGVTSQPVGATTQRVSVTRQRVGAKLQLVDVTAHLIRAITNSFARTVKRSALAVACYASSARNPAAFHYGFAVDKRDLVAATKLFFFS